MNREIAISSHFHFVFVGLGVFIITMMCERRYTKQIDDLAYIDADHNSFWRAPKTFQNFHPGSTDLRQLLSGTNRGVTHQSAFCVPIGIVIARTVVSKWGHVKIIVGVVERCLSRWSDLPNEIGGT